MRVLHVLHHSVPYVDGYSVRSQYIVDHQRTLGLKPVVLTSAQHEIEVGRPGRHGELPRETIDGVSYYRTPLPGGHRGTQALRTPFLRQRAFMARLRRSLDVVLERERIDIVHAHSPVLCGLPALLAARRRELPVVYEVRAFWEDALLEGQTRPWSAFLKHACCRALETALLRRVHGVVAISQHLVNDIAGRGVPAARIHTVPNGVDLARFRPLERDAALVEQYSLEGCTVLGFIGSFYRFEGLDCLLQAMAKVVAAVPRLRLVLVGDGEDRETIRRLVRELDLGRHVILVGRVPHDDVGRYYSVMDIMVYPRHRSRMTELVTPLKPLEALAMGKLVIGSDVGGMREVLDEGRAGLLFKAGDAHDLARQLLRCNAPGDERLRLTDRAARYVATERSWRTLVSRYIGIYQSACA